MAHQNGAIGMLTRWQVYTLNDYNKNSAASARFNLDMVYLFIFVTLLCFSSLSIPGFLSLLSCSLCTSIVSEFSYFGGDLISRVFSTYGSFSGLELLTY